MRHFKYLGILKFCKSNCQSFFIARKFSTKKLSGLSKNVSQNEDDLRKVAEIISRSERENIIVMVGAGLSTASGIPDFRSPGTGLYDNLKKFELPYPEAIFDINYFMLNPLPFYTLAKDLYPSKNYHPNLAHYFLRLLNEERKLKRIYTQNIDGLERLSGVDESTLVECHGSFASTSCTVCKSVHPNDKFKETIFNTDDILICQINGCKGKVKPDIVFFGENLPDGFWNYEKDALSTDILMVLGTSLEVYPFASICDYVPDTTRRILINREVVGSFGTRSTDLMLCGDIVETVQKLTKFLKLKTKLDKICTKYNYKPQYT